MTDAVTRSTNPQPGDSKRWWSPLHQEHVTLLEVCCGPDRPGDMRDAVIAAGGAATGVDILAGIDLLDDEVFQALSDYISLGRVANLWLGIVCSSLSRLWLQKGRPQLRSRLQPDGIQPVPRRWRGYILRANRLIERCCDLAWRQFQAGGTFYIENPADVGFMASPHFKYSKRAAVSLWITSWVRRLVSKTKPVWGTTAMCGWAGRFQKLTTICAAGPGAAPVRTLNYVQCECPRHVLHAYGVDAREVESCPSWRGSTHHSLVPSLHTTSRSLCYGMQRSQRRTRLRRAISCPSWTRRRHLQRCPGRQRRSSQRERAVT